MTLIDEIDKSDINLPNDLLNFFEEGMFNMVLIDEIDTGDIDLPNDLLNYLKEAEFITPELERPAY